jgi:hypothetical protein
MRRTVILLTLIVAAAPGESHAQSPTQTFAQGQAVADRIVDSMGGQGVGVLAGPPRDTIIAEGDSWFAYPGLDVLGALTSGRLTGGARYSVFSAASAGDTVESMAYDDSQLEDLFSEFVKARDAVRQKTSGPVRAILLSGGGNDIATTSQDRNFTCS